ncbi:GDSL family lipase [Christiangramia fulva]|uniref:GDSL family lipase n=1 Tax=Christiangramia fulva TaxID=2126553 RepID=A0A2R3Z5R7_9FLAO|nr:GDSL-type esterase/lipase family protein [Christiangramia fulva]AVR45621.1 GDSL family lipase [Christiangramia fulva]
MSKNLFSLHLFLGVVLSISVQGIAQENVKTLYPTDSIVSRYHNDWTQKHYQGRIQAFEKDPLSFDEIVFIGNSITEKGGDWAEKFEMDDIRNRGISGDLSDGVLKRLAEPIHFKPRAVFLLIGINDLFNMYHDVENRHNLKYDRIVPSVEYIANNILKIAKEISAKSPSTKVYVRTVLPTRREFLMDDIAHLNDLIQRNEKEGFYTVIDLYSEFVDKDGMMIRDFTVDGVHLTEEGYSHWVSVEKSILELLQ